MNRVIKKTVSNVFALKIPRKCFCSQAVKVDASTNLLPSNEHGWHGFSLFLSLYANDKAVERGNY
uniref:Uncharacterized protein n=1 Tax=Medicago truncatula TaxID=3880 RepID=I3SCZ5_MEDTR|nr:unknown [Medicago truncatula]